MPSTLGCAILGLLARRESSGYELKRRLEQPVGYFWTARHSQIYPELARLTGDALISHREVAGRGPRPNKRHRITDEGLRALASWVCGDPEPQPVRDLEVLRLWSIWTVSPESATAVVRSVRRRHVDRLLAYEAELSEVRADPVAGDPAHPLFASLITLEGGVRTERAAVDWCDWMLAQYASGRGGADPS